MNEGTIELATKEDAAAIYALYRSLLREPYSTWDEDYPSREIVDEDLLYNGVLVLRLPEGGIGAAIVVEKGEEFEADVPWYPDVTRWCALGRLGVAHGMQGRGVARRMLSEAMAHARAEGYEAVRFLVGAHNVPALRSYATLGFEVCGHTRMWDEDWLCYEKRL